MNPFFPCGDTSTAGHSYLPGHSSRQHATLQFADKEHIPSPIFFSSSYHSWDAVQNHSMLVIHYENIFHLHFSKNPNSNTNHKDHIEKTESCCFLFHVRINKNIQNHNSTERHHCDENRLPKTYRQVV